VSMYPAWANRTWIVYAGKKDAKQQIWKMPLNGGEPVSLTEPEVDAISPALSPDGKSVAYLIRETGRSFKLGVVSIDGGMPLKIIELPATMKFNGGLAWNKTGDAVLFVNTLGTTSNIWTQPLNGGRPTALTAFKEFQIAQFALNAEGNRLAVARGSRNRDIVLIKNLRK